MLTIGEAFPKFELTATVDTNPETAFKTISSKDLEGKWAVVFFWPKDFTFICPTEIVAYDKLYNDFADRDCQLLGASVDSEFVHMGWRKHKEELNNLKMPMLADVKRELSDSLGILSPTEGVTFRATFIIDNTGIIRHVTVNDLSVGRNPQETLRILDALQSDELCPCNWSKGEETIDVISEMGTL